jgi:hypothetical protein
MKKMAITIHHINNILQLSILSVALGMTISCCTPQKGTDCIGIKEGQYRGKAMLFFHRPGSGSTYEILLFPICGKNVSSDIATWPKDFEIKPGVSLNLVSDDSLFKKILNHSRLWSLAKREQLDKSLQSIYVATADIEVNGIENVTRTITGSNKDTIKAELYFSNGKDISLSYVYISQMSLRNFTINPQ